MPQSSNILVTGAAGRIGRATVAHLLQHGYCVRAVDLANSAENIPELNGAEYSRVDMRDANAVAESCEGIDTIVHLAGIPNFYEKVSTDIYDVNVSGTFYLYDSAYHPRNSGERKLRER